MAAGKTAVPFPCSSSTRHPNQLINACSAETPRASRWLIVPVLTRWQGERTIPVQPNDRKWCTWSLCDHEDNQTSVSLIGGPAEWTRRVPDGVQNQQSLLSKPVPGQDG